MNAFKICFSRFVSFSNFPFKRSEKYSSLFGGHISMRKTVFWASENTPFEPQYWCVNCEIANEQQYMTGVDGNAVRCWGEKRFWHVWTGFWGGRGQSFPSFLQHYVDGIMTLIIIKTTYQGREGGRVYALCLYASMVWSSLE